MSFACSNCATVIRKPRQYCPVCNEIFEPLDDITKVRPTEAEDQLLDDIVRTSDKVLFEQVVGVTQCPHGCEVDAAGHCEHGYMSLGMRAGITSWTV